MTVGARRLAFVGSYASDDEPGIVAIEVDVAAGTMVAAGRWSGFANPSFLAVAPDGAHLFAVGETAASDGRPGRVYAAVIEHVDDRLRLVGRGHQASEGDHPCHLDVHPSGRWLAVSNYGSGTVAILPVVADGSLRAAVTTVHHTGTGPNPSRQEGPHAHAAVFTPDGRHLIAADLGADRILVHAFDPETGELAHPTDASVAPGAGPRHLAVHPAGRDLLVANELDSTVAWYEIDPTNATTTLRQTVSTLPSDVAPPENLVAEIRLGPAADRVYVSNRGHDSIAVFAFDRTTGLERFDVRSSGGRWPRHFALVPGGALVANERSDEVCLLRDDAEGAPLAEKVASVPVRAASCVALLPPAAVS
jgi:6-phosphogluconolactonase